MKNDSLYHVFNSLSRIIIVFAIAVFIIGLVMRFNQPAIKNQTKQAGRSIIRSPTKIQEKINTQAAALNLKGPFVCEFSSKDATASGYIKDSRVFGRIEKQSGTTNILLNNDCFYIWESFSSNGEKICGLNPYMSMIENLPLLNLLGNITMLPIKTGTVVSVLNSCRKEEIKNEKVFDAPKNINFIQSTRSIFPRN